MAMNLSLSPVSTSLQLPAVVSIENLLWECFYFSVKNSKNEVLTFAWLWYSAQKLRRGIIKPLYYIFVTFLNFSGNNYDKS